MLLLPREVLLCDDDRVLFARDGVDFVDRRTAGAGMGGVGKDVGVVGLSSGEGFITRKRPVTLRSLSSNNHTGRSEGVRALAMWYSLSARVSLDSWPGGVISPIYVATFDSHALLTLIVRLPAA